ncbi:MAG: SRPBCC domain-containing protein [Alphaproteobacteria bacterium]|nr:SRPBCC domain-containing protein [Alphaproteobacteria bacterium]
MQKQSALVPDNEPVIALTHVYDAPRALVWEVFTKPEHLVHWWGPAGFAIEHEESDFRVGGHWKFVMIGPDGTRWQNYHQYTDIDPMDSFTHRHGSRPDDPDAPDEIICFADRDGGTEVTMRMTFSDMAARQRVLDFHADTLGLQTLAKAEAYIKHKGLLE